MVEDANRTNWTEWERAWAEKHINADDVFDRMSEEQCNKYLTKRRVEEWKKQQPKKEQNLAQYMYEVAGTLD